jgi:DNA-binding transcriptional LysR family regulator
MFWSSGLYPQVRLSIKALRYFLVAAERGSIARAAEALHVAPSAVASAIESTEQEFKLKLVQRFPAKGIKPTAAGATLMHKIRRLIEEYDTLFLEGTDLRMALSGSLAVGYYAPVAPTFMPDIVGPLVRGNPEVRLGFVECDNEGAQSGLLDGKFDAILFVAENVRAGIAFETLLEAPPYLLAHRDHPLARSESVAFGQLSGLAMVLLDLPFTSEYYRGLLDAHGVAAPLVALASTTEMVRSLVGAGIGCSILNMRPATQISYAGDELIAIPIRDADRPLKLVLGTLGGNPRRLVQAFSDACRAHFARPAVKDLMTCRVPS